MKQMFKLKLIILLCVFVNCAHLTGEDIHDNQTAIAYVTQEYPLLGKLLSIEPALASCIPSTARIQISNLDIQSPYTEVIDLQNSNVQKELQYALFKIRSKTSLIAIEQRTPLSDVITRSYKVGTYLITIL